MKPVALPTTSFGSISGTAQLSALDGNFGVLAAAANDLATYSNYFVDSGSAGALTVTVPSPLTCTAYSAGLLLFVKVAVDNAAQGATINVNGLGAKSITYGGITFGGSAGVLPGQLQAGSIVPLMYDGTNFQYLGSIFGAGSFGVTATGFTGGGTISGTLDFAVSCFNCELYCPATFSGVSATTGMSIVGIPSYLQPNTWGALARCSFVLNNSTEIEALLATGPSNTFQVLPLVTSGGYVSVQGGGFTASGTKGLTQDFNGSYPLQ